MWSLLLSSLLLLGGGANAEYDIGYVDDEDLMTFVTRPEIRSPKFKVTKYDASRVDDGYWFVAPYADIMQQTHARNYYQPCQTGPHIYDADGKLVWTGACQFVNQNSCDFRPYEFNGTYYMSVIFTHYPGIGDYRGKGMILDNTYTPIEYVYTPPGTASFNMHELVLIDNGNRALFLQTQPQAVDLTPFANITSHAEMGWISNAGFTEFDRVTNKTVFEWWAYPRVSLSESSFKLQQDTEATNAWNWFHPNSVDKNAEGDYIFSSRYTNTIYKVSGKDGSVLWRLSGGEYSSFELQNFNFSRQHDARWIESTPAYDTISLLDNGGDGMYNSSNVTTGLVVKMDKTTMKATAIQKWVRPDDRFSALRGNFQTLPSGNVFGGWSDNCHISEHTADGELLMEAEFTSKRFVSYRAYKANFSSDPPTQPDLKAITYGFRESASVTIFYVSWNGATKVASWSFYRQSPTEGKVLIGNTPRIDFESRFQVAGYFDDKVFVEALDRDGAVLERSVLIDVEQQFQPADPVAAAAASAAAVVHTLHPAELRSLTETAEQPIETYKTEL